MRSEPHGEKVEGPPQTENPKELLLYWIRERYDIFLKRKTGVEKPWSQDEIFQRTYFCNVHRENDRVTRWIRDYYNPQVGERFFEYNIVLSRFINWPGSLARIGYLQHHDPSALEHTLGELAKDGKVWGGAYVITTHGMPMGKAHYLCHYVLEQTHTLLDAFTGRHTCASMALLLQQIEGIGSFLAGQIVADLKNTPGHELYTAPDKKTFVAHGPGSLRGLSWFINGTNGGVSPGQFYPFFQVMGDWVRARWPKNVPEVDNQDLQNCLCEFDKYMRVLTNTGRSKRGYKGA
jgi:hypothetical protein